jgi:hypothetical protein
MKLLTRIILITLLHLAFIPSLFTQGKQVGLPELLVNDRDVPNTKPDEVRVLINTISTLSFGAFYPGSTGGTINISKEGIRTATGSVILLGSNANISPAVFEIRCPAYTLIHIVIDKRIVVTSDNGGSLICVPEIINRDLRIISPRDSESGFIFRVGAEIYIDGAQNISPGNYSGRINLFVVVE